MGKPLGRGWRLLLGVGAPAGILFLCWQLYEGRVYIPCLFREVTGLYCPGCGSGHAVYALLHGRVGQAFSFNPMLFLLGVPAAAVLLHEYLRLVFPRWKRRPVSVPQGVAAACAALLLAFWIARNIPALSFLAP